MDKMSLAVMVAILLVELSAGKGEPPQSVTLGGIFLDGEGLLGEVFLESVSHLNSDDLILPLTLVSPRSSSSPSDSMSLHTSSCSSLHSLCVLSGCGELDSVVGAVAAHSHIPHLSTEIVTSSRPSPFSLYLGPSKEHMDLAIQDILRTKQFHQVLIVTHKHTGLLNVQNLMESLQVGKVQVWVADVDSKTKDWHIFTNRGIKVIVVDIGIKFVHLFVDQALKTGILNEDSTVIFTSLDFSSMDLERVRATGASLLGFSLLNRNTIEDGYIDRDFPGLVTLQTLLKRDHRAALIFDSVNLFGKALDQLGEKMTPPTPTVSCLDDEKVYTARDQFMDVFRNISHVGVTGNIKFARQHREEIKLYIQQIVDQGLIKTVGSWTRHVDRADADLLLTQIQNNKIPPQNLIIKSNKIKVKSALGNFLMEDKGQGKEGNDRYFGFVKDLLDGIMNQLQFDYELLVEDRKEPETGVGRELVDKVKVDIEVGDLTMTSQKLSTMEFSVPFMTSHIVAVAKKSLSTSPWSLMTVLSPFPTSMWLTLLFSLFFSSLLLLLVASVSPYERHSTSTSPNDKMVFLNAAWVSLSGLLLKSVNVPVQAVSTRAFCWCCWMLTLLIVVLYSSSLHGLLSPMAEDQTLDKLLHEENFTFGAITNGPTRHLLQKSGDPNLQTLITKLVGVDSADAGLDLVLSEDKFCFLIESPQVPLKRLCELDTVGTIGQLHYGLTFNKGSSLTRIFNSVLLNMAESGEIQQLIHKWLPQKKCPDIHVQAANELPFYGCLLFLVVSSLFCLLISLLELVYFSFYSSTGPTRSCWEVLTSELDAMAPAKEKDDCRPRSPVYLKDIYASTHINITDSPFKQSSNDEESPVKNGYSSNNEDNSVTDSNIHLLNYKRTNGNAIFQN